jgi:hypothetical protein
MSRILPLALMLAWLAGCSGSTGEGAPASDPAPEAPSSETSSGRALPPEVPDADPMPTGFEGLQNYSEEESRAWRSKERGGVAVIRAVDAGTGEPIPDQMYYGIRFAFRKEDVDRRPHVEVDWRGTPEVPDGVRRNDLAAGWWRLRLEADDYRPTWTPRFRVEEGKTTDLTVRMLLSNRLRVTVLEPDGTPCADGTLVIRGPRYLQAMHVSDGVGETSVHRDTIQVSVDPRMMEGYRPWTRTVEMSYGETTEVTVRLER